MRISDWSSDVCSSDLSSATVRPPRRSHEDERSGKPFEGGSTMKATQIFLLAGTSLSAATPALAQDAAADGVVADGEILVTAQRRAESIKDVGMAILAVAAANGRAYGRHSGWQSWSDAAVHVYL